MKNLTSAFTVQGFPADGMISGRLVQYHNHPVSGIAGIIIVVIIIHHLTLENNNDVHNVIMSTATIKAPSFRHTNGHARNQWENSLWCGTLSILQLVYESIYRFRNWFKYQFGGKYHQERGTQGSPRYHISWTICRSTLSWTSIDRSIDSLLNHRSVDYFCSWKTGFAKNGLNC